MQKVNPDNLPFPGAPSHLDYTQKLARSTLALKLSVTTHFHWVTTTPFAFHVKATTGVYEACLHQVHRPYISEAILSQTYGNV